MSQSTRRMLAHGTNATLVTGMVVVVLALVYLLADAYRQATEYLPGLPDGHDGGSCAFVVKADGKELWRSPKTEPGTLRSFKVSVDGAANLERLVEDAGDGIGSDWGCWFAPQVTR